MSQRYEKRYILTPRLYTEGAPILFMAGGVLFDTETNEYLAQLKFKSVTAKTIAELQISLDMEFMHSAKVEEVKYTYSQLSVQSGATIGNQIPVYLSSNEVKAIVLREVAVVFEDGSSWASAEAWQPLPTQESIRTKLETHHQQVGYRSVFGAKATLVPMDLGTMWLCTCSAPNAQNETECSECHASKEALLCLDKADLEQKGIAKSIQVGLSSKKEAEVLEAQKLLSELKDEEEKAKLEKVAKQRLTMISIVNKKKKKTQKIAIIGSSFLALCLTVVLTFTVFIPYLHLKKAEDAYFAGDYHTAYEEVQKANDFYYADEVEERILQAVPKKALDLLLGTGNYTATLDFLNGFNKANYEIDNLAGAYYYASMGWYKEAVEQGLTTLMLLPDTGYLGGNLLECYNLHALWIPYNEDMMIAEDAFRDCHSLYEVHFSGNHFRSGFDKIPVPDNGNGEFLGWYLSPNFESYNKVEYFSQCPQFNPFTLYARWKYCGGFFDTSATVLPTEGTHLLHTELDSNYFAFIPTRSGRYTFTSSGVSFIIYDENGAEYPSIDFAETNITTFGLTAGQTYYIVMDEAQNLDFRFTIECTFEY